MNFLFRKLVFRTLEQLIYYKFTLQIALSSSKILLRHHEHNWTTLVLLIGSKMSLFLETALIALPDNKLLKYTYAQFITDTY